MFEHLRLLEKKVKVPRTPVACTVFFWPASDGLSPASHDEPSADNTQSVC